MKEFDIEVRLEGVTLVEDPHCPFEWIGSGCYDIEVPVYCYAHMKVYAESEERAREIAMEYDFDVEVEEICSWSLKAEIKDLRYVGPDDEDEEFVEVSYDNVCEL